jgi:hypothetical protein
MAIEYNNTLRGTSVIRIVDPGTYYINLTDLRANTTTETVSAFDIKRVYWSTNGNILVTRNGNTIMSLHNSSEFRFDDLGYSIANNNTSNVTITINTGGTLVMETSKVATYNVDPYTGYSIP